MKPLILLTVLFAIIYAPLQAQVQNDSAHKAHHPAKTKAMKFEIPPSLKQEHKELHTSLEKYTGMPGKTGIAAKEVANILHPHFVKEEEYALPPLGLLADLAKGKTSDDMKASIAMADKLKKDWDQMLAEHKQITTSLEKLRKAAKEEGHPEVVRFTESLKLHAQTEEEVLYPAAILIGEYLKLKSR